MSLLESFGVNDGKGNPKESAIYAVACTYSYIEKEISDYLRPFGLTPAKFNTMMVIKHVGKDKGISQIEIGRRLIVTASNMTRVLDKLEKEGFIERFQREGDRRVKLIKISKKGSDILDKLWTGYRSEILSIANKMDSKDLKQISNLLIKWCAKLGEK